MPPAGRAFVSSGGKRGRPLPGAQVKTQRASAVKRVPSAFQDRWLLLEHVDGVMPDIRAAAIVSKAIRDALLSGYKRIGKDSSIPEVVSGHAQDGSPSRLPHLAIVFGDCAPKKWPCGQIVPRAVAEKARSAFNRQLSAKNGDFQIPRNGFNLSVPERQHVGLKKSLRA
jgi:CRISPR-associated protein Csb2